MKLEALGEFEHQVLLAMVRLGGTSYTVPVVLELEERTGKQVAPAAVFITLSRLQKKGLLSSRRTTAPGERTRRYFKLRPLALKKLKESRRMFLRLWEGQEGLDVLAEEG